MAGVIGLRGPDIDRRDALRGYRVEFPDAIRPIIRPHTGSPVLTMRHGEPVAERHVFGFSRQVSSFNARDDRLGEGRMWSSMFGRPGHHGVAPVSYILEWSTVGGAKRPYRIERADGAAMAVPALVGPYWEDRTLRAFALVTIRPNRFVGAFHDRMIGQLRDDQVDVWLRPDAHTKEELRACLAPPAEEDLVAYPLDPKVGAARFDDAAALDAVGPPLRWPDVQRMLAAPPAPAPFPSPAAAGGGATAKGPRQTTL